MRAPIPAIVVFDTASGKIRRIDLTPSEDLGQSLDAPEDQALTSLRMTFDDEAELERARSGYFRITLGADGETAELHELPFRALRLDMEDVLESVETLSDSSALTERHIDLRPHGGECDNEPGKYRWDRKSRQLVALKRGAQKLAPSGVSLERAFSALLDANPQLKQPDAVMVWQAGYRAALDAQKKKRASE